MKIRKVSESKFHAFLDPIERLLVKHTLKRGIYRFWYYEKGSRTIKAFQVFDGISVQNYICLRNS